MTFDCQDEWTVTNSDGLRRNLTHEEKLRIVTVARELYDRFVMGGWEPWDAYAELAALMYE